MARTKPLVLTAIDKLPPFDRKVFKLVFNAVKGRYGDGRWHKFSSKVIISGKIYFVFCDFKLTSGVFTTENRKLVAVPEQDRVIVQ